MPTITRRGESYFAQVRIKKGGALIFSESRSFATERLAESWAMELEKRVRAGQIPRSTLTVGKLILDHLEYLKTVKPPGRSQVQNYYFTAHHFSDIRLTDLRAKDIINFALERRAEGVSASTVMSNLSPLSASMHAAPIVLAVPTDTTETDAAMEYLKNEGIIAKSRQVDRPMLPAEEKALMEAFAKRNKHHQCQVDMVKVMNLATALPRRAGELTRLRWKDINKEDRTIIIRDVKHPKKKMGNDQVVPLVAGAWEAIHAFPVVDELILPFKTDTMLTAFERVRDRIAERGMPTIKDLRFHDLRHHGITRLFRLGLSIQEVALVSGHTQWSTLRRYTHLRARDLHKKLSSQQPAKKGKGRKKPGVGGADGQEAESN